MATDCLNYIVWSRWDYNTSELLHFTWAPLLLDMEHVWIMINQLKNIEQHMSWNIYHFANYSLQRGYRLPIIIMIIIHLSSPNSTWTAICLFICSYRKRLACAMINVTAYILHKVQEKMSIWTRINHGKIVQMLQKNI